MLSIQANTLIHEAATITVFCKILKKLLLISQALRQEGYRAATLGKAISVSSKSVLKCILSMPLKL